MSRVPIMGWAFLHAGLTLILVASLQGREWLLKWDGTGIWTQAILAGKAVCFPLSPTSV